MQNINVALVQIDQVWEDKTKNLNKYTSIFSEIKGVDLIVLPEMFQTGFSMKVEEFGEEWNNSSSLTWLIEQAKTMNCALYTSLIIHENGNYYNRGVFVYPSGEVEFYDKRKSFGLAGEDQFFTAGTEEKIIEYKGWKIQLQICYDLRFPEIVRNNFNDSTNRANYDLILYVANWPEKRSLHWTTLLSARAIENQSYVIGVNRVGEDGKNLIYSGDSQVIDPLGEVTTTEKYQEKVIINELDYHQLQTIRKQFPFLKDRMC